MPNGAQDNSFAPYGGTLHLPAMLALKLVNPVPGRHLLSMALLPPMYTTNKTGTSKPRTRKSKALLKAESEHARFLKRMGVGDPGRKIEAAPKEPAYARPSPEIPSLNSPGDVPTKPKPKVYRGKRRLLGVATMHKSNMVPVFADNPEEAVEIAKMRR